LPLQSQSHLQRKKDSTPDGVSTYAFEDGIIRLSHKDFALWEEAYSQLDLRSELMSLSQWATEQGKNWFHAVKGALSKRNRELAIRHRQVAAHVVEDDSW